MMSSESLWLNRPYIYQFRFVPLVSSYNTKVMVTTHLRPSFPPQKKKHLELDSRDNC